jgi:hypothetical protein
VLRFSILREDGSSCQHVLIGVRQTGKTDSNLSAIFVKVVSPENVAEPSADWPTSLLHGPGHAADEYLLRSGYASDLNKLATRDLPFEEVECSSAIVLPFLFGGATPLPEAS